MRRLPARPAAAVLLLASLACATPGVQAPKEPNGGAELEAVIDAVKQAIGEAQASGVAGLPKLTSITLTLETTVTRSATGEVRYLVATAGAGVSDETVSKLELELAPLPPPRRTLLPAETLKDALGQAIHLAAVGVAGAAKGEPPLVMKSVVIDLKFTVTVEGSASAGVTVKLLPVGLTGTASASRSRAHRVRLTFGG